MRLRYINRVAQNLSCSARRLAKFEKGTKFESIPLLPIVDSIINALHSFSCSIFMCQLHRYMHNNVREKPSESHRVQKDLRFTFHRQFLTFLNKQQKKRTEAPSKCYTVHIYTCESGDCVTEFIFKRTATTLEKFLSKSVEHTHTHVTFSK